MTPKEIVKIIFQPSGRRGKVEKGISIIEAARRIGADIEALCGEKGVCGKCKVRIEEGFFEKYGIQSRHEHVSEWQEEEEKFIEDKEREDGYRLGCCAKAAKESNRHLVGPLAGYGLSPSAIL